MRTCDDIIEEIGMLENTVYSPNETSASAEDGSALSAEEELVYRRLSHEPVQIDSLSSMVELPVKDVSVILVGLEMKGRIREMPGKKYARRN